MSKHTPGPWRYDSAIGSYRKVFSPDDRVEITNHTGSMVACTYKTNFPNGQDEANVRLLAAAPELLEACKNALNYILNCGPDKKDNGKLIKELGAAIAKAEGEE